MICEHQPVVQTKIITLGKDRYHQKLEHCSICRLQVSVKLTPLKEREALMGWRTK